jgi:hypothetical protein
VITLARKKKRIKMSNVAGSKSLFKEDKSVRKKDPPCNEIDGIVIGRNGKPVIAGSVNIRYNCKKLERFRPTKGNILMTVTYMKSSKLPDVSIISVDASGEQTELCLIHNFARGLKRAKTWSALLSKAFNPRIDVVITKEE